VTVGIGIASGTRTGPARKSVAGCRTFS
jgi:hypothetical protein